MARTDLPLTPATLRRCALALRLLADLTREDAALAENAARREDMETQVQIDDDLAAQCQRLAMPTRKG
jgi:hypothetical protein